MSTSVTALCWPEKRMADKRGIGRPPAEANVMAAHVMMNALTRAVSWTAGLVEGLMTGLRYGSTAYRHRALPHHHRGQPFGELRAALLGRNRKPIARVL